MRNSRVVCILSIALLGSAAAFAKSDIESAGFSLEAQSDVLRNPADDRTLSVFDEEIRGKTDRFVYRFVELGRPGDAGP